MARTRKTRKSRNVESSRGEKNIKRGDDRNDNTSKIERTEGKEESSKEEVSEVRVPKPMSNNDPAWYMQYPELAVDSANIPYSQPLGTPLNLRKSTGYLYGKEQDGVHDVVSDAIVSADAVPGICSVCVKHTIGYAKDKSDAVNVAANALYTNVRFVNSGRKNYDPADLFMYCLTMGEMYAFIEWCKRLYGMAFVYSQQNKYIGKALIEANGVNPDNLVANLANFRMYINTFINKVSSYAIPAGIPYFSRRVFMYSSVYTESETGNIKDQLYQFIPAGFFKFGLDDTGAGKLGFSLFGNRVDETDARMIVPNTGLLDVGQIITYGTSFLDYIAGDEDFGLMSGDILKAYDGNIITLSVLDPEYVIVPVYDLDVLRQFRNATPITGVCPGSAYTGSLKFPLNSAADKFGFSGDICQSAETGNILCMDSVIGKSVGNIVVNRMNKILDLNSPAPTIADNLECSRLVTYADWRQMYASGGGNLDALVLHTGTEIPVYVKFSYIQCNVNTYNEIKHTIMYDALFGLYGSETMTNDTLSILMQMNKFHYAPFAYFAKITVTEDTYAVSDITVPQNLDNYVTIDEDNIKKMHDCALLSMFFAPGVAKVVSVTR